MSASSAEALSVIVERALAHPPERVWRTLTQPHLIAEWLMTGDIAPVAGHRFNLRGDWGGVLDCEILTAEPHTTLSYRWDHAHDDAAYDLTSVVTFTLTPIGAGTLLRVEQRGFRPDQKQAHQGARLGWRQHLEKLEDVLERTA